MVAETSPICIERIANSKIHAVDFENIPFGKVFADHMFAMEFDGKEWIQPRILPFQDIKMSPAASVIHYGQAIFEGMKVFRGKDNHIRLFRPTSNIARFNRSAQRMCMPEVSESLFLEALTELIKLDKDWVPSVTGSSLYVRPFMYATDEYIGVKPSSTYRMIIFTCPVNKYYAGNVKVKVETHFTRSVKGGTGFAKAAGNYAGALYPAKLAQNDGFSQLVWTDAIEHKYIEESGTMNIIFRKGNTIFTPALSDSILDGITRDSVLKLARDWGYVVEERKVAVDEIEELLRNDELDEAFGAGTAATVACIETIAIGEVTYNLPTVTNWEFAQRVSKALDEIKRGDAPDNHQWNYPICEG
jgi:branched-chain amino acid aminotransferase